MARSPRSISRLREGSASGTLGKPPFGAVFLCAGHNPRHKPAPAPQHEGRSTKTDPTTLALRVPSVSTRPGLMALTRICLGPSSRANVPVMASTAPFVPL